MSETIAIATGCLTAEANAQRREEDTIALAETLGLPQQAKLRRDITDYEDRLERAGREYNRIGFKEIFRRITGRALFDVFDNRVGCITLSPWWGRKTVHIDELRYLQRPIPYAVLLAIRDAKATGLFDSLACAAPRADWGVQPTRNDPILLGIIKGIDEGEHLTGYFELAAWGGA